MQTRVALGTATSNRLQSNDTLIGDNGGVYHPALLNDRLLLGLKGKMSAADCVSCARDSMAAFATGLLAGTAPRITNGLGVVRARWRGAVSSR